MLLPGPYPSKHPYQNSATNVQNYEYTGATSLHVQFSADFDIGEYPSAGRATLTVEYWNPQWGGYWDTWAFVTGTTLANGYLVVPGDKMRITLSSEAGSGANSPFYGYEVIAISDTPPALPESDHPYAEDLDDTVTYVIPDLPSTSYVVFDPLTDIGPGDQIYITNTNTSPAYTLDADSNVEFTSPFTGSQLSGALVQITGDRLNIRLVSNSPTNTAYGYKVNYAYWRWPFITIDPYPLDPGETGVEYYGYIYPNENLSDVSFTLESGTLPPGLTLTTEDSEYGYINGFPTTDGTYTFTIRGTNNASGYYATHEFFIDITTPAPPVITTTVLPDSYRYVPYNTAISSTGTNPKTFSITSGTLPTGIVMSSAGVFTAYPGPSAAVGTYTITVQATNAYGSDSAVLDLVVLEPTPDIDNPEYTPSYSLYHATTLLSGYISASGSFERAGYGPLISPSGQFPMSNRITAGSLPTGMQLVNGQLPDSFSPYQPTVPGLYSFEITSTNRYGSTSKTFSICVGKIANGASGFDPCETWERTVTAAESGGGVVTWIAYESEFPLNSIDNRVYDPDSPFQWIISGGANLPSHALWIKTWLLEPGVYTVDDLGYLQITNDGVGSCLDVEVVGEVTTYLHGGPCPYDGFPSITITVLNPLTGLPEPDLVDITTTQTQTGRAQIIFNNTTATQNQIGFASVKTRTIDTISGRSRVTALGRIVRQWGLARIDAILTRTQGGRSRIFLPTHQTLPGRARIRELTCCESNLILIEELKETTDELVDTVDVLVDELTRLRALIGYSPDTFANNRHILVKMGDVVSGPDTAIQL